MKPNSKLSGIIGVGSYLPPNILTNFDLEKILDTTDEWITSRTGIKERRIAGSDEFTSTMAVKASKKAIEMAGIKPQKIDMIIFCTISPDYPIPCTAGILAKELGIKDAGGMDVNTACTGFIYGIALADAFIKAGKSKYALVVCSDKLSAITDYQDRSSCILFGDGAGAVVMTQTSEHGVIDYKLGLLGDEWEKIVIPAGGSRNPASEETVKNRMHYMRLQGREVFKLAVKYMGSAIEEILKKLEMKIEDINWIIPHQANRRIIEAICKHFKIPQEKVFINIEKLGNTSGGSIPIAIDEMLEKKLLKKGDILALSALGAGVTYGAAILKWGI
ncbi:3-oxoacyl-[acyl-carrier-protein] synthase 3 [bacterium HR19]|nr:3-oxoacyl-[acyl-carrier-protein] synthase 3 [bacterium HR19]